MYTTYTFAIYSLYYTLVYLPTWHGCTPPFYAFAGTSQSAVPSGACHYTQLLSEPCCAYVLPSSLVVLTALLHHQSKGLTHYGQAHL